MILLELARFALGCATALAVDWGAFEGMAFRLRGPEVWPEDFRYRDSNKARKVLLGLAGGVAGALWNDAQGRAAAVIAASILHLLIYVEWYRWRGSRES